MENNNEAKLTTIDYEAECKRLTSRCEELERMHEELEAHLDFIRKRNARLEGIIEALEFAIRCDGVSGADVEGVLCK